MVDSVDLNECCKMLHLDLFCLPCPFHLTPEVNGLNIVFCPAFRDMRTPISVLTGLDYWLDNLMCNVPEVAMCFHINGIVKVIIVNSALLHKFQ